MRSGSLLLVICIAAAASLLGGCASTETIRLAAATDSTFAPINAQGQQRQARVLLTRRPPLTVVGLRMTPDSTFWLSPRTGRELTAPTLDVLEIRFSRNRAWKGAILGAAIGVALGLALGENCSGRDDDETCISRIDLMPMGALVGGLLGGLFGARSSVRYRIDATPPP